MAGNMKGPRSYIVGKGETNSHPLYRKDIGKIIYLHRKIRPNISICYVILFGIYLSLLIKNLKGRIGE
jgi:hypothetical protein